jgi:magnesium chelatase family protein
MLDRIDLQIQVPAVTPADLALPAPVEGTAAAAARVAVARAVQAERGCLNAHLPPDILEHAAAPDRAGEALLNQAAQQHSLTARSYHRVLRVARTIADLDGSEAVRRVHIAEALSCRRGLAPAAGPAPTGARIRGMV